MVCCKELSLAPGATTGVSPRTDATPSLCERAGLAELAEPCAAASSALAGCVETVPMPARVSARTCARETHRWPQRQPDHVSCTYPEEHARPACAGDERKTMNSARARELLQCARDDERQLRTQTIQ